MISEVTHRVLEPSQGALRTTHLCPPALRTFHSGIPGNEQLDGPRANRALDAADGYPR